MIKFILFAVFFFSLKMAFSQTTDPLGPPDESCSISFTQNVTDRWYRCASEKGIVYRSVVGDMKKNENDWNKEMMNIRISSANIDKRKIDAAKTFKITDLKECKTKLNFGNVQNTLCADGPYTSKDGVNFKAMSFDQWNSVVVNSIVDDPCSREKSKVTCPPDDASNGEEVVYVRFVPVAKKKTAPIANSQSRTTNTKTGEKKGTSFNGDVSSSVQSEN